MMTQAEMAMVVEAGLAHERARARGAEDVDIDATIARAEALLCWMDADTAAAQLMDSGVSGELAFLAVRAAEVA